MNAFDNEVSDRLAKNAQGKPLQAAAHEFLEA